MTFADIISLLSKELGITLEIEGDICAVRMNATDGTEVTILLRGLDRQGAVLLEASLGSPRPEGLERLYRTLLEANDLFRDTGGATLSLAPDTGRVRLPTRRTVRGPRPWWCRTRLCRIRRHRRRLASACR